MKTRVTLLFALLAVAFSAQEKPGEPEKLAPYYPTPETIVQKMLQLGALKADNMAFMVAPGAGSPRTSRA